MREFTLNQRTLFEIFNVSNTSKVTPEEIKTFLLETGVDDATVE